MTREQIVTEIKENDEWMRQLRAERERIEGQLLSLSIRNEELNERRKEWRPMLELVQA
jgi:hypothetical protein